VSLDHLGALVIGCGSGADTWAAWLKSRTLVHAIDINPMAIVNTYATARLGGYHVEAVAGDITNMTLLAQG
jgi:methylase of polypeptide subunit release factors